MSSAHADVVIREFLESRGGNAAAGEVVTHASNRGLAASTVRRAADRVAVKSRQGNRFIWSLPASAVAATPSAPAPEDAAKDVSRTHLEAQARDLGVEFDEMTSEEELDVWIEYKRAPWPIPGQPNRR